MPTVSISFKDKEIASILDFIAKNSGYKIDYEPELRTAGYKATVSFDEVTPEKAVEGHAIRLHRRQQDDPHLPSPAASYR